MTDEAKNPEKKIIIDEGWKDQVEAEREAEKESVRRAAEAEKPAAGPAPGPRGPMPPANLTFLVSSLYLQGAMSLGLLLNPETKKPDVQLDQAKHSIDLLTMLQDKTAGNRTPDESAELEAALHELRLAYVGTA
jgi:hypothetical protein